MPTTTDYSDTRLLVTLLVRDEIDIIADTLAYYRSVGVGDFIVMDNGSTDGTAELLRDLADKREITLLENPEHTHDQGKWVTHMASLAAKDFAADWIIHCDADEFLWFQGGNHDLRSFFGRIPSAYNLVKAKRINMLRHASPALGHCLLDNTFPDYAAQLGPKACHRPHPDAIVADGNHHVSGFPIQEFEETSHIVMYHYPFRSYQQYQSKIVKGAEALQNNTRLSPKVGGHWRSYYNLYKQGRLPHHYRTAAILPGIRAAQTKDASISLDAQLADHIRENNIVCPTQFGASPAQPLVDSDIHLTGDEFGFIDVGARGGAATLPNTDTPVVKVLVEPDSQERDALKAADPHAVIIGSALADIDGLVPFIQTVNPCCCSLLEPNFAFLRHYGIAGQFKIRDITAILCARFDTLYQAGKLPVPHCVKLDVQGYEFQALKGFGDLLHETLAIKLETHFYPLYKDQKLIGDLVEYLSQYNFVLRKIANARSPDLSGDRHFTGDLVEVDAYFTKSAAWITANKELAPKFALAHQILGLNPYILAPQASIRG
jgi:FkbM family methyltransferase